MRANGNSDFLSWVICRNVHFLSPFYGTGRIKFADLCGCRPGRKGVVMVVYLEQRCRHGCIPRSKVVDMVVCIPGSKDVEMVVYIVAKV